MDNIPDEMLEQVFTNASLSPESVADRINSECTHVLKYADQQIAKIYKQMKANWTANKTSKQFFLETSKKICEM